MRMIFRNVLWAMLMALGAWAHAEPPPANETFAAGDRGQSIVRFIRAAESAGFSGAVLAAKDGEVVAAVGAGFADLERKTPNTPATLFEIASATKQFTAAAILRLAQEGKLQLDDSIAKHLPSVPESCRAITIRHLLQHTSGIPGSNAEGAGDDVDAVIPSFLRGGPQHPPGTHWEYWNQGYALLSEIVARAAGASYASYCRERLFAPAGMTLSCFTGDEAPVGAAVAVGTSTRGAPRSALDHPYGSYGFQYRGMGGAVTNVWELWRWDRALNGEAILGADSKAELFKPGLSDYALGWFVRMDEHGRLVHSHGGGVRGFVCEIRRYPASDGCIFVLCNSNESPLFQVARAIEERLFDEPRTILDPPKPLERKDAEALAGTYQDDRSNQLTITSDGAVTRARLHWSPPRGPVTNATLGADGEGGVVLYEWSTSTPLTAEAYHRTTALVQTLTFHGMKFNRTK
jgi:CubicO group peptidase (beta-lactamase class C family)